MTAKEKVLEKFPKARSVTADIDLVKTHLILSDAPTGPWAVLGGGNTEAEAWQNAYDRIREDENGK